MGKKETEKKETEEKETEETEMEEGDSPQQSPAGSEKIEENQGEYLEEYVWIPVTPETLQEVFGNFLEGMQMIIIPIPPTSDSGLSSPTMTDEFDAPVSLK